MYQDNLEQMFKLNKNLVGPISEIGKATTDICRHTAQQNLELLGENLSRWSDQLKRYSSVRKPEDLINLNRECMNENSQAAMETIQVITSNMMENFKKMSEIWSANTAKFGENVVEKTKQQAHKAEKMAKESTED